MTRRLTCWVGGIPASKGSKRLVHGRMIDTDRNLRQWQADVAHDVRQAAKGRSWDRAAPVVVDLDFRLLRPAHPTYPYPPRPDIDKLARAVLDALTQSGVIADDSQVARLVASKKYAGAGFAGVQVTIRCQVD